MTATPAPRDVVILGSTGSIGTQALDIVRRNPGRFRVVALAAGGGNPALLARQAVEFGVPVVAVADEAAAASVADAVKEQAARTDAAAPPGSYVPPAGAAEGPASEVTVLAGVAAVCDLAALECDVVLNGVTGAAGLRATLAALDAGRTLALANKESLIIGGPLVTSRAKPGQIVPVDSEHSTIAQCLRAGANSEVRRLVLTASGGPFRGWPRERLESVTPEQALAHPTWRMGPLVTTNSATLVNKGLEVIEAYLLFGFGLDQIDVVVHPQSIVHSMVEFADGATIIQASPPDMRIPIALGLAWPDRVADAAPGLDWSTAASWTFEPLDDAAFPAVGLAREAARLGGTAPAVYNAANEACVADFLAGSISFPRIVDTVARVVSEHNTARAGAATLEDVLGVDAWARARARELTRRTVLLRRPSSGHAPDPGPLKRSGTGNGSRHRQQAVGGTAKVKVEALGWLIFLVALLLSVMLHETGHFVAAKRFGMKATRYFVGFGPTLWSFTRGETEYGIKALPFGGFVKIEGMTSLDEVDPEDEPRSFRRAPGWQRLIVLAAGSFMHFVLAALLIFGVALGIGAEVASNTTVLGPAPTCVPASEQALTSGAACPNDAAAPPATLAGLQAGDKVTSFDGTAVSTWTQLYDALGKVKGGTPVTLTVERDGHSLTVHTKLATVPGDARGFLGIADSYTFQRQSFFDSVKDVGSGFAETVTGSASALAQLPAAIPNLFKADRSTTAAGNVTSVVGAARDTGDTVAADEGWQSKVEFVLLLIASLNIFVGLLNLLPLLPMDGGHVAVVIWERIKAWFARLRHRPDPGLVDYRKLVPLSFGVFVVLVIFGLTLILADLINPVNIG